jgi:prophage antirepressor-like protein
MNELQIFENSEFGKLEVFDIDGKPYFPARQCAEILGHTNPERAIREFCKGVTEMVTPTFGGNQAIKVISEGDLYRLITRSRIPGAERFEHWVFDEVLPSIRKHGLYATPDTVEKMLQDPDTLIKALTALKEERKQKELLREKVEQDKPKVKFAEAITKTDTTIYIGELAKILKGNGIDIGQNRLFEWLRQNGFLVKNGLDRNMPTQYAMDLGLFRITETVIDFSNSQGIRKTTVVTGKGQRYFIDRFLQKHQETCRDCAF